LPSNVPGGLPNQGGPGAGDQTPDSVQAYRAEGRRKLASSAVMAAAAAAAAAA